MFKVYVIVAGLAVVVPPDRYPQLTGISAVLVDAAEKSDVVGGKIPKHEVTLSFRGGAQPVELWPGTRIKIRKSCVTSPCRPDLSAAANLQPDLTVLSGKKIREECVDPTKFDNCVDAKDKPLVHTWVGLEGPWTARAATTCSLELSRIKVDTVDWEYRKRKGTTPGLDPKPRPGDPVKLGNAYVFELESDTNPPLNDIELSINGIPKALSPAAVNACKSLSEGATSACAIVELTNHTHGMHSNSAADRHFALLYDLFDPATTGRWVPFAKGKICDDTFRRASAAPGSLIRKNPPGERCGGGGG
jgi:hypothetical protein